MAPLLVAVLYLLLQSHVLLGYAAEVEAAYDASSEHQNRVAWNQLIGDGVPPDKLSRLCSRVARSQLYMRTEK